MPRRKSFVWRIIKWSVVGVGVFMLAMAGLLWMGSNSAGQLVNVPEKNERPTVVRPSKQPGPQFSVDEYRPPPVTQPATRPSVNPEIVVSVIGDDWIVIDGKVLTVGEKYGALRFTRSMVLQGRAIFFDDQTHDLYAYGVGGAGHRWVSGDRDRQGTPDRAPFRSSSPSYERSDPSAGHDAVGGDRADDAASEPSGRPARRPPHKATRSGVVARPFNAAD